MWIIPAIVGQRVILNPESENYEGYNGRQSKGNAGYIIGIESSSIEKWAQKSETSIKRMSVRVKWDHGYTNSYRLDDLLPVGDKQVSFTIIEFSDGSEYYRPTEELESLIDEHIIVRGHRVHHKKEFGKEYRDRLYEKVAQDYKNGIRSGELDAYHMQVMQELLRLGYGGGGTPTSTEESVISQLLSNSDLPFES